MRALALLLPLVWLSRAGAEVTPSRLDFARSSGGCGDEETLRRGVIGRLGADPFHGDADRAVVVRFARRPDGLVATVELRQAGRRARRTLRSPGQDCDALTAAVELAVSLAVDPLWEPAVSSGAAPAPPPPEAAPIAAVETRSGRMEVIITDEELPVDRPHVSGPWHIGAGTFATFGSAPELVVGLRVELGLRTRAVWLTLEPWLTIPAGTSAPGGHLSMTTVATSLVGCWPVLGIALCGELSGGVLQAVGEGDGFVRRSRAVSPFAAVGGRVLWASEVFPGLDLRLYFDALVPVLRTRLTSDATTGEIEAWSTPVLLPSLGAAFVGHFG